MLNKNRLFIVLKTGLIALLTLLLSMSLVGCNEKPNDNDGGGSVLPYVMNEIEIDLEVGEDFTLQVLNLTEEDVVVWSSNNELVVNVADGVVSAVKPGTAKVTATVGGKSLTCAISVSVKLNPIPTFAIENLEKNANGDYVLNLIKGDQFVVEPAFNVAGQSASVVFTLVSENQNVQVENLTVYAENVCESVGVTATCEYGGETYTLTFYVSVGEVA